ELRRMAAEQLLRGGHLDEGVAAVTDVLRAMGMHYPGSYVVALILLLLTHFRLVLRGLEPRKPRAEPTPSTLTRIDVCWSRSSGLSTRATVRSMVFQKRMVLLALDTGEPFRVARALAAEIMGSSAEGTKSAARTAQIARAAEAVVSGIDHPYPRALMNL